MSKKFIAKRSLAHRLSPVGAAVFASCLAAGAMAAVPAADELEEVVVSGYRASLESSTRAKMESVGFSDSIFAEDIGKFPDTNIAESFNRIPGINISREVTGEGLNIAIRGLGTNFTRVTLNNAPIAIGSTGRTDSQNTNREVDLDLFPSELFSQLTVSKSASAHMLEGGAAGTVNMRSARPFDRKESFISYQAGLSYNTPASNPGYRGTLIGSKLFGDFGVLAGVSAVRTERVNDIGTLCVTRLVSALA
jgi:TonB-dependent receptor